LPESATTIWTKNAVILEILNTTGLLMYI